MFLSRYEKFLYALDLFKDNKKRNINDLFKLDNLVLFWINELMGRMQRLFIYENMPFPQREFENTILTNGIGSFVKSSHFKVAEYGITPCTYSGVTEYSDIGTIVRWCTPVAWGQFPMQSKDGVLVRNNSLSQSVMPFLTRYATLLANNDISLLCALTNVRSQSVIVADSKNVADSVNAMFKSLENGKRQAIVNEKLFQTLQGATALPLSNTNDAIKPILEVYDTILQMFYNDIGIRYNKDKKERMIENEVTSDTQRLLINIEDMFECRQKACDEINDYFGLNISVKKSNEIVDTSQNVDKAINNFSQLNDTTSSAEEQKQNVDYNF